MSEYLSPEGIDEKTPLAGEPKDAPFQEDTHPEQVEHVAGQQFTVGNTVYNQKEIDAALDLLRSSEIGSELIIGSELNSDPEKLARVVVFSVERMREILAFVRKTAAVL